MKTTVVIVSYKSDHLIEKNIEKFDNQTKIIVIENSQNINLKNNLEIKYKNVNVVLNTNSGFGQAANLGANLADTKYIFFCSPDNYVERNAINELENISSNLNEHFGILILKDETSYSSVMEKIKKPCGISSFFVKKKMFLDLKGFDENFFLYYEDTDLVKRFLNYNHDIYRVPIKYSNFLGSHDKRFNYTLEINRNWHYMWSKFYFRKKHFGYIYGFISTFPYFIRAFIKIIINYNKTEKKAKYLARLKGLYNSYALRKSWFRPKIDN